MTRIPARRPRCRGVRSTWSSPPARPWGSPRSTRVSRRQRGRRGLRRGAPERQGGGRHRLRRSRGVHVMDGGDRAGGTRGGARPLRARGLECGDRARGPSGEADRGRGDARGPHGGDGGPDGARAVRRSGGRSWPSLGSRRGRVWLGHRSRRGLLRDRSECDRPSCRGHCARHGRRDWTGRRAPRCCAMEGHRARTRRATRLSPTQSCCSRSKKPPQADRSAGRSTRPMRAFPMRVLRYSPRRGSGVDGLAASGAGLERDLEMLVDVTLSLIN